MGSYSSFLRNIGEGPITIVSIERAVQRRVVLRMAVCADAILQQTVGVLIDFPNAIVHHEKVEQSVIVVIEPTCANRPHLLTIELGAGEPCLRGDVSKGSVAIVVEQLISGDVGQKDIGPTVVVVVPNCYAHSVTSSRDACVFRYIGKRAVMIVVEEPVPVSGRFFLQRRNRGAVYEINIEISVAVIVEESDSRYHRFHLILVRGSRVPCDEVNSSFFRNVFETNCGS